MLRVEGTCTSASSLVTASAFAVACATFCSRFYQCAVIVVCGIFSVVVAADGIACFSLFGETVYKAVKLHLVKIVILCVLCMH